MAVGGEIDHAGGGSRGAEVWREVLGEDEVAQVICRGLRLDAVYVLREGRC